MACKHQLDKHPSRASGFWRVGLDDHPFSNRRVAGSLEGIFPANLHDTNLAGSVMIVGLKGTQPRNQDLDAPGGVRDGRPGRNLDRKTVDREVDLFRAAFQDRPPQPQQTRLGHSWR